jgi:hypothetical protein
MQWSQATVCASPSSAGRFLWRRTLSGRKTEEKKGDWKERVKEKEKQGYKLH